MRTLLWFRGKDLRVHDHAALHAARDSRELIAVFVLDPAYFAESPRRQAPHRLQFMLAALGELSEQLAVRGSQLHTVHGPATQRIPQLAAHWQVERVLAIASVEPGARARDERIRAALKVPLITLQQETLSDLDDVHTAGGSVFRVYTPFARAVLQRLGRQQPLATPRQLPTPPAGLQVPHAAQLPTLESVGLTENTALQPGGERAGQERLKAFLAGPVASYESARDRMDLAGTSRLSADLHFGTLSVRTVWAALEAASGVPEAAFTRYRAELLWREFSHYTLWHHPQVLSQPFRPEFRGFPWRHGQDAQRDFEAWWYGQTGYPVVDAAARQLLQQGFVHNRARMIAASFLTKHLLIDYRRGELHYLRYLTDGDLAQNNLGWQWSAGCGCDAQPYFRIFNPVTQGQRFDPEGDYVRALVPELRGLPTRYIHAPWLAPADVLQRAEVRLGRDYPVPIVEHASARQRFLALAAEHLKGRGEASAGQKLAPARGRGHSR